MLRSFEWDFRSNRKLLDILSVWQSMGPFEWRASDNDVYGRYIVARDPTTNMRIKIVGAGPDYTLDMHFDVEPERMEETRDRLVKDVFVRFLPAADATDVRPSGKPMSTP